MSSRGGSLSRICRGTGAGRPDQNNLILPYDKLNLYIINNSFKIVYDSYENDS